MPPTQEPDTYPNNCSNGWVPYGPEPTREDYANGYGKLAMRKEMYGDMAWGMMTVTYANYRPNREPPSERLRNYLLQPPGPPSPPGPPTTEILKREYLLEGSVPDVPALGTTERPHVGPIQRPTPQGISHEPHRSQDPLSRGDQAESSIWLHHTPNRSNGESLEQPHSPAQNSSSGDACVLVAAHETGHHHAHPRRERLHATTPFPAYRRPRTRNFSSLKPILEEDSSLGRGIGGLTESKRWRRIEASIDRAFRRIPEPEDQEDTP